MSLSVLSVDDVLNSEEAAAAPAFKVVRKVGRPSRFSPQLAEGICALIQFEGYSDTQAGLLVGVPKATLSRWKAEDEEFAFQLEQARAFFQREHVQRVLAARRADGAPDWRASAWLLQRMFPEQYGSSAQRRRAEEGTGRATEQEDRLRVGQETAAVGVTGRREGREGEQEGGREVGVAREGARARQDGVFGSESSEMGALREGGSERCGEGSPGKQGGETRRMIAESSEKVGWRELGGGLAPEGGDGSEEMVTGRGLFGSRSSEMSKVGAEGVAG